MPLARGGVPNLPVRKAMGKPFNPMPPKPTNSATMTSGCAGAAVNCGDELKITAAIVELQVMQRA